MGQRRANASKTQPLKVSWVSAFALAQDSEN